MNIDERGQALAIGQRIRARRLELGLSQRQLSQPGVSYAYISRLEAGTRTASVKTLRLRQGSMSASSGWRLVRRRLASHGSMTPSCSCSSGRSDPASASAQAVCLPRYASSDPTAARVESSICAPHTVLRP
jgi:hypothetical protein